MSNKPAPRLSIGEGVLGAKCLGLFTGLIMCLGRFLHFGCISSPYDIACSAGIGVLLLRMVWPHFFEALKTRLGKWSDPLGLSNHGAFIGTMAVLLITVLWAEQVAQDVATSSVPSG